MSTPGDLSTLSDRFLATVAHAVLRKSTTTAFRVRLEEKMREAGHTLSTEKLADMRAVIDWLRLNEGKQ